MTHKFKLPANDEPISESVNTFLKIHFHQVEGYINREKRNLKSLLSEKIPNIDYIKLYKFFRSAVDQLKTIDSSVILKTSTLFFNINKNISIFEEFSNKNISSRYIFDVEYIRKYNKYWTELDDAFTRIKNERNVLRVTTKSLDDKMRRMLEFGQNRQDKTYKMLNKRLADSLYSIDVNNDSLQLIEATKNKYMEEARNEFMPICDVYFKNIKNELISMINIKMYLFDKILWASSKKSKYITNFFKTIIRDEISLTTYIKYYLRTQSNSIDPERIYLEKCIKIISEFEMKHK